MLVWGSVARKVIVPKIIILLLIILGIIILLVKIRIKVVLCRCWDPVAFGLSMLS